MGKWPKKPVSFLYFGDELIASEDLDPVYCTMSRSDLDGEQLKRMLLAYWCYYSVGTTARIVEPGPDKFYTMMWKAHREKWPHGFERRYFYGDLAANTLKQLEEFGSPEAVVDHMTQLSTFQEISKVVKSHYGFGPWMAFKVADMSSCVLGYDVDFNDCVLSMYRDPVQGCALMYHGDKRHPIEHGEIQDVVDWMIEDFSHQLAPPHYDRPVNLQEVETVLCKFKSYAGGSYYPGKDIKEVGEGLEHAHELGCDLAQELLKHVPPGYTPHSDPYPFLGDGYHPNVCGLDYV